MFIRNNKVFCVVLYCKMSHSNEALWVKWRTWQEFLTQWMLHLFPDRTSVNVEEVDCIIMVCLHVFETKNNFIYMTKILLILIKLVCDTTWLSSYFNTISKTLPWYINELIVNLTLLHLIWQTALWQASPSL